MVMPDIVKSLTQHLTFDFIDISDKYIINHKDYEEFNIKNNKKLKEFIVNQMSKFNADEQNIYISVTEDNEPVLFFVDLNNIIYVSFKNPILIFDNYFKLLFSHGVNNYKLENKKLYSFFTVINKKLYSNFFYNKENILDNFFSLNLDKNYTLEFNNTIDDNLFNFASNLSSKLISVEFKKDYVVAKFVKSLYQSIIMDYDLNIIEISFHKSIQKRLNLNDKIFNVNNYQHLLSILSSNFEMYKLINDSNFKSKTTEKHFNNHIDFIKKIIVNKENIINKKKSLIDLFINFEDYEKNQFFNIIDRIDLYNLDFYNYFDIEITKKFKSDPFKDKTFADTNILYSRALFLLIQIEEQYIKNNDKFKLVDDKTLLKLLFAKKELEDLFSVFNS